ncbi:hypothetical protein HID58_003403, partial [Brassica napus]
MNQIISCVENACTMRQAPRDLKKRLETMSVYLCETTSHSAYAKAIITGFFQSVGSNIQVIDTVERICLEADSSFFPAFGYIIEVLSNHGVDFEAIQVWKTRKNKERDEGTLSPREVALLTNLLGTPIGPAGAILQGQQKSSLLQPGLDVIQGGFLEIEHDFTNQRISSTSTVVQATMAPTMKLETMPEYLCGVTPQSAYTKAILSAFFHSVGSNVTANISVISIKNAIDGVFNSYGS